MDRRAFLKQSGGWALGLGLGGSVLADVLTGCGTAPSSSSSGAPKNLTFYSWQHYPHEKEVLQKYLATPFEKAHPGSRITIDVFPGFQNFTTKLQSMYAAGTPPDVYVVSVAYAWDYAHLGQLVDLQPYVNHLNQSDYYMEVTNPVRYPNRHGNIYAFPYDWVTSVLYYNKDLFDKAKVPYPNENWTYDDLLMAAKELTGPGQWGIESYSAHTFLDGLIRSNGGEVLNKAYTKCLLGEPESMASIQWAVDLIHKYHVAPAPDTSQNIGLVAAGPFQSGKIAMQIDGSWGIQNVKSVPFNWDIAMVPKGKVKRVIYGGPNSYGIAKGSKNPELAWEWIQLLSGAHRPYRTVDTGSVPMYKPRAESSRWLATGNPPAHMDIILKSAPYVHGAEFGHNWIKWRLDAMNSDLAPSFISNVPLSQTVPKAVADINKILAEPF